jgi:hypothetical protein
VVNKIERKAGMKNKVVLLAMFTAIVAYDCFSISPGISADSPGGSFQPVVLERRELVAGGKCVAKLTFSKGVITKVESETKSCYYGEDKKGLLLNNKPVLYVDSVTFGSGTTTCYGPPNPAPAMCICTAQPCP